jgi:uncharacterized Ntn-hydrolase superfamily protein
MPPRYAAMRKGTYSIVARDPETGEMGVAVQSHWFSVGSVVAWARAGVGAVATQSIVEPAYGPRLLERLEGGAAPAAALAELTGDDEEAHYRQVAVVDKHGAVAVHTGEQCIAFAGHAAGAHYCAQANMMASEEVWPAMARGYEAADGPLAERLLAALDAAEGAGGDVRGRQSAALVVVGPDGEPWKRRIDLRVEDHSEPLAELRRVLILQRAYDVATEADDLTGQGRLEEAGVLYQRASEMAPDSDELLFWAGLAAAQAGDLETGVTRVRRAIEVHDGWSDLLGRLSPEIAPAAGAVRDALQRG